MSHATDIHTLSGAYALDALTEIERAAFSRHLAQCEACVIEVAELRETASRLGSADPATPPPRLREAVLAEVGRTRQITAGRTEPSGVANVAVQRWRRWTAAAVAAGVFAVGAAATVGLVQEQRLRDTRDEIAAMRAEQARVSAILAAGDLRVRTQSVAGGGTVMVAHSPAMDKAVVAMSDLATPERHMAYQLWLVRGSSPVPAGVLDAGQRDGTIVLDSVGAAEALGVTLEPAGGSATPTSQVLVGVALT